MASRFRCAMSLVIALSAARLLAQKHEFWFDTGRPLAKAADELEQTYGWVVNYEDVPVFGPDTLDITAQQHSKIPTITPNGLAFGFSAEDVRAANDPKGVLENLVAAYAYSNNAGKFEVRPIDATTFDLVPDEIRDCRIVEGRVRDIRHRTLEHDPSGNALT